MKACISRFMLSKPVIRDVMIDVHGDMLQFVQSKPAADLWFYYIS